jgi:hypothetical protein
VNGLDRGIDICATSWVFKYFVLHVGIIVLFGYFW